MRGRKAFCAALTAILTASPLFPSSASDAVTASDRETPAAAPAWRPVANVMSDERWAPAALVLSGGTQALIVGGFSYSAGTCVASADLYDERANSFSHLGSRLTYPRDFATASPLPNGKVLIAGGYNLVLGSLATLEIFDPAAKRFTLSLARLSQGRELFTATTLQDGRILFAAGFDTHAHHTLDTADLYDPRTGAVSRADGRLSQDRFGQAAALLPDGRVLLAGGKHWRVGKPDRPLASAEIFDPATGRFHPTAGEMAFARDRPAATPLLDGTVLISGGQNGNQGPLDCEVFDPKTETFHIFSGKLAVPRMAHGGVTTPAGTFVFGGWDPAARHTTNSSEFLASGSREWSRLPNLPFDSHDLAALAFPDGAILVAGGKFSGSGKEGSRAAGAILK
jgi:hypothetical protein